MNDISDLERRMATALDRIGAGLEGLERPAEVVLQPDAPDTGPSPEVQELRSELEAERQVTAQLEERVRATREKQDARVAELEAALGELQARLDPLQAERQALKRVNAALRASNEALRAANAAGLADPGVIDTSMQTELDALRTVQKSDATELDGIIADLAPLLKSAEAGNA